MGPNSQPATDTWSTETTVTQSSEDLLAEGGATAQDLVEDRIPWATTPLLSPESQERRWQRAQRKLLERG